MDWTALIPMAIGSFIGFMATYLIISIGKFVRRKVREYKNALWWDETFGKPD